MRSFSTSLLATALVSVLLGPDLSAQTPADTYFSLAVTENSHNHSGARLLYLDFQEAPFSAPNEANGEVASLEVLPGAIVLDGDASEWDAGFFTDVSGLVQDNHPLSEYIDALQTEITVGSAWDATHVYLVVQWEDKGHNASTRYRKWIFGDQGVGLTGWNQQRNVGAAPGTPNAGAVNVDHVLAGDESEDRVFLMFPIVDTELNFVPGGPGCAFYCHTNLFLDDPFGNYTGDGVAVMHTNVPGDTADTWHWKSSRSEPSGFADDKWIEFGLEDANGRRNDAGSAAYSGNGLTDGNPTSMHVSGLGYTGDVLLEADAVPYAGARSSGDEIPRNVSVAPAGSRGDVETAASFDSITNRWTVEFRRLRDTGNADDHSFEGASAAAPTDPLITTVDPVAGELAYAINCEGCHQPDGAGLESSGEWVFPIVQRTSGSHIIQAIYNVPIMDGLEAFVTEQDIEDIAAYLQQQAKFEAPVFVDPTPCGSTLSVFVGSPVSFTASAVDIDPAQSLTLDATGVPAGASFSPGLPTAGNPVSSVFDWTPTNADVGTYVIELSVTDPDDLSATCAVTVEVLAECHLVLGDGSGTIAQFTPVEHTFFPQVGLVLEHHPVLMNDIPEFVIPDPSPALTRPFQPLTDMANPYGPVVFDVQVLMWNPVQFPDQPEQWTQGMRVTVLPDGRVHTRRYGSTSGMLITAETGVDAHGQRVIRFPFVVPGL